MSILDVIADVIEEIHESERSLMAGDIPDRQVFRHVKSLWQLLLGIDESLFYSHNYEYFELKIGNENKIYTGFTYLGNNSENISDKIENSVGSSSESMKIVELLDKEDSENTQETSVSFKLSLLNKIRFILFEHHIMIDKLFREDELFEQVSSYIQNEVRSTNSKSEILSISNNTVFNDCYKESVEMILGNYSLSIDEITNKILDLFKLRYNVAYFFDINVLLKFNDQIISLLTRVFKKHHFVVEEIDDFYKHNPIFPMLKPIYRNMTLKMITNDVKDEIISIGKSLIDEQLISKLDISLLMDVLHEVVAQAPDDQDDMPVTMKWFPQIVKYYCESLINDGTINVETDLYITMIKKVTILWIDNKIDTNSFISKLCDISLIPTAMPYNYQGIQFPTVHMRMALYTVKENIRLNETYFDHWKALTFQNIDIERQYEKWRSYLLKNYFSVWKNHLKRNNEIENTDVSSINNIKLSNFFEIWENRNFEIKNNNAKADIKYCVKYLVHWSDRLKTQNIEMEKAVTLYDHKLKMKYFTLWISSKLCRFSDVQNNFAIKRRELFFKLWKSINLDMQVDYNKAIQFRNNKLSKIFFLKWKKKSITPLVKLKKLDELETKFSLTIYFNVWMNNLKLLNTEKKLVKITREMILRKYLLNWYQLKKLTDKETILLTQSTNTLAKDYFNKWNKAYHFNKRADDFYLKNNIQLMFNLWKLKYKEIKVEKHVHELKMDKYMKKWKLITMQSQFLKKKNNNVLRKTFISWFEKSSSLKERLEDCEDAYPIFKTATYFDSWKKIHLEYQKDIEKANRFNESKTAITSKLLMKYIFESIKLNYYTVQKKKLELGNREIIHQKKVMRKYLGKLIMKKQQYDFHLKQADDFYQVGIQTQYFETWLGKFDSVSQLQDILNNKLETDNVNLLMQILSKLQLKMIKMQTDLANADKFKGRWDRIKTKTFFELWKMKLSSRTSPTPTARSIGVKSNEYPLSIPDLNPYIDLEPRDRGSPLYRPSYQSKMQSVLTGNISQYKIEEQIDNNNDGFFDTSNITPAKFRTPTIRKINSRLLSSSSFTNKNTQDTNSIFTSAERVRRKNLEERVSRYRLLRSPPKNNDYILDSVKESNDENVGSFHDSSIFDTTAESITSSTPLKNGNIIEM